MRTFTHLALLASLTAVALPARAGSGTGYTDYHGDKVRSGSFIAPTLTWASAATLHRDTSFVGAVPGNMFGEPLYWLPAGAKNGYIIIATDANVVAALDATTGLPVWKTAPLGSPGQAVTPLCPTKRPVGITGTPVIDRDSGIVYFDVSVQVGKSARHVIYGLSLADGSLVNGWPIDIGVALSAQGITFQSDYQGQHSALALINGKLYVTYGGNRGDCGPYHGWVVGLNVATPAVFGAWSTTAQGAGIWSQGGVTTADGVSLFVATGNAQRASRWADQNAVFRLSPTLQRSTSTRDYYYPSNWSALDHGDLDLDGTAPLPVDIETGLGYIKRWLLQFGKDGKAYVLDRDNLNGMDGALLVQPVASTEIVTAPAVYPTYGGALVAIAGSGLNCPAPMSNVALTVLKLTATPQPAISTAWCASMLSLGAPIVTTTDGFSNPVVWITSTNGDHMLHGYNGNTGAPLFTGGSMKMRALQHFSTLLAAQGRLYVGSQDIIYAFDYTPGL